MYQGDGFGGKPTAVRAWCDRGQFGLAGLSVGTTHRAELGGSNGPGRSDEKAAAMIVDLLAHPGHIHVSASVTLRGP